MKKLLIGLLIGLTIGYAASASAAVGDTVSAVFASFNYVVNGTDKAVSSPVLVYEGTSYVRTTDIGNMLGFDVTYKSDSRTIAFNGGTQTLTPAPSPTPSATPTTVTGGTYGATPSPTPTTTQAPSGTPDPNATPSPTPDPNATPVPTVEPTPTVTPSPTPAPTPTPAPSNTAQCEAIRHDYAYQIAMVEYTPGNQGQHMQKVLVLQYERDQKLSAAGCN